MTKEKTARLIPNAIQIATKGEKVKTCIVMLGFGCFFCLVWGGGGCVCLLFYLIAMSRAEQS